MALLRKMGTLVRAMEMWKSLGFCEFTFVKGWTMFKTSLCTLHRDALEKWIGSRRSVCCSPVRLEGRFKDRELREFFHFFEAYYVHPGWCYQTYYGICETRVDCDALELELGKNPGLMRHLVCVFFFFQKPRVLYGKKSKFAIQSLKNWKFHIGG